jgi:ATP-dependent DNA ligase
MPLINPMSATLTKRPVDSNEWLVEIKRDGYRIISRNGTVFYVLPS